MNHLEYPKIIWVLTKSKVIIDDNKEVVDHTQDHLVGGTFDAMIADKLISILKEHQSIHTMLRTDAAETSSVSSKEDSAEVNRILSMVEF